MKLLVVKQKKLENKFFCFTKQNILGKSLSIHFQYYAVTIKTRRLCPVESAALFSIEFG